MLEGGRRGSGWPPGRASWTSGLARRQPWGRGRCRSCRRGWRASVGRAVPRLRRARVRRRRRRGRGVPGSWCWRGSSSRPASWTRCGCWPRPGSTRPSYATLKRRLPRLRGDRSWRQGPRRRRAPRTQRSGRRRWCSIDVTTLYFETDHGDGFREPGFSKERRLEPQITIGLLTDAAGFPLMVEAFEGNKAETTTMLPDDHRVHGRPPAQRRHRRRRRRDGVRGQQARRSRRPGCRSSSARGSPTSPTWSHAVAHASTPAQEIPDGQILTQPWPGRAERRTGGTRSSTTSTAPTGPGAPCAGSTSRSPRPRRPSPGRRRSSGTGSSASPAATSGEPRPGGQGPGAGRVKGYITNLANPTRRSS